MAKRICRYLILFVVCLLAGCAAVPRGVDPLVLNYQRQIAYLEGRLSRFASGLGEVIEGLGDLTVRSSNIIGGVDEVITLFDEYQRRVDELISIYRSLTDKAEGTD